MESNQSAAVISKSDSIGCNHFISKPATTCASCRSQLPRSKSLRNPTIGPVWLPIAFGPLPFRQGDLLGWDLFPRYSTQEMGNTVQAGSFFIIGLDHVPGRLGCICGFKHCVSRTRIVEPPAMRFQVHGTQLPVPHWILDALQKSLML